MWPNPQETADLVTFPEEILNEKLCFLCSVCIYAPFYFNGFQYLESPAAEYKEIHLKYFLTQKLSLWDSLLSSSFTLRISW